MSGEKRQGLCTQESDAFKAFRDREETANVKQCLIRISGRINEDPGCTASHLLVHVQELVQIDTSEGELLEGTLLLKIGQLFIIHDCRSVVG